MEIGWGKDWAGTWWQRNGKGGHPFQAAEEWSGNKILGHECQAAGTSALGEGVLLRRFTQKGILKQGMHTKEGHFVLFFTSYLGLPRILCGRA